MHSLLKILVAARRRVVKGHHIPNSGCGQSKTTTRGRSAEFGSRYYLVADRVVNEFVKRILPLTYHKASTPNKR